MDTNTSAKFISSLTKSLQTILHGCLEFERDIELGGYIYLKVDSLQKVDYVLNEKMQKNAVNSLTFFSNSFHAVPLSNFPEANSSAESRISNSKDSAHHSRHDGFSNSARQNAEPGSQKSSFSQPQSRQYHGIPFGQHISGDQDSSGHLPFSSDSYFSSNRTRSLDSSGKKVGVSISSRDANLVNVSTPSINSDASNLLVDFQTAFRSPERSFTSSSPSQSSVKKMTPHDENASDNRITACQPQEEKTDILPDSGDMEVIYIKAEDEDEILSIPLHPPGSDITDNPTVRGKPGWLSMGLRQPFYFPYSRFTRSHSWDSQLANTPPNAKSFISSEENNHGADSLTCKLCGKSYRSRQGLIFHERVKHQNVFNVHCPICGKGFQQTTHMYGHMATHTNVKNFQCHACGAKYAHKTSLQQHQRTSFMCRQSSGMSGQSSLGSQPQSESGLTRISKGHAMTSTSVSESDNHQNLTPKLNMNQGHSFTPMQNASVNSGYDGLPSQHQTMSKDMGIQERSSERESPPPFETVDSLSPSGFETASTDGSVCTDEKPNTLSPLNVNQMPMSIPEMLQQSLSQHQTDNVAHPGWFDPRFQTAILPDPFLQQQQPSPLQGSATPSNTFMGFTQAFSSQSGPRTPSRSSLQSRFHNFTRINCSMCGHVSYTSRAHARHMTIRHSRIGNFVCGQCGKTFQTKLYLAQHMKSHGERQYACEVCGKRFLYKHHLPRHQLAVHGSITFNTSQD